MKAKHDNLFFKIVTILAFAIFLTSCDSSNRSTDVSADTTTNEEINNTNNPSEMNGKYIAMKVNSLHEEIWDYTIYENTLYYISYEQSSENPNTEQAVVVQIDLDDPDTPIIIPLAIPPQQLAVQIAIDDNGSIHIITKENEEFGYWGELVNMFWHQIGDDGEIIHSVVMPLSIRENGAHILYSFEIDADGNAYIAMGVGWSGEHQSEIYVLNPSGDLLFQTPIKHRVWFMFKDLRGEIYFHQYSTVAMIEGVTTMVLSKIDITSQEIIDNDITHLSVERSSFHGLDVLPDGTLFISNMKGVYDVDMESTLHERFLWTNIDNITISRGARVHLLSDDKVLLANIEEGLGLGQAKPIPFRIIRKQTADDIITAELAARAWEELLATGKVGNLTLGVVGRAVDPAIRKAIEEFNIMHPYSQILVKQYGSLYGFDQSEGITQLNNDIIKGNSPDILLLHQDISYGAYVKQGLFQDLYPYLEADEGFDMSEYRENIIRAYDVDGGLYGIPIAFAVELMYGHEADLAGISSWNMDEFIAFADRFPESRIFRFPTQTDVLDICLKANGGNMVDWVNGTGLDMELLVKKLEFANRFVSADSFTIEQTVTERAMMGDIRLMTGIARAWTQEERETMGGQAISFVGFPSEKGNGYLVSSDKVVAISSNCQHTITAWQFISHLLSENVQASENLLGYPVKRSSIEGKLTSARERSGVGGVNDGRGDIVISFDVHGATFDEINLFLEMLERATEIRVADIQVDSIIKEEAGAYFSGQKSVEEVVAIIENRVGIYVKELR
jgi:ABC-type glycerol-3-phosphate transport system substrate-binding protein